MTTYSLTKSQMLIYNMDRFVGGSISVICGSMLLNGNRDIAVLRETADRLYRINDALRLRLVETEDGPRQYAEDYAPQQIQVRNFDSKDSLDAWAKDYARLPLDLYGSLFEIQVVVLPESYGFLVKLHHLVGDAWTLALLGSQVNAMLSGNEPLAYSYLEHQAAEAKYLVSERYCRDREFFLDQFRRCDEVTFLSEKKNNTYSAARSSFVMDAAVTGMIHDYALEHRSSPFSLFLTTLAVYINRTRMGAEKFFVGTTVLNRTGIREKNTAGMFINTIPVLMEVDDEVSFEETLHKAEHNVFSAFRHQKFNYGDTLSALRETFQFGENLYDVSLSYQNASITGSASELETTWYPCGMQTESLQIHIDDRDNEGTFRIHYDYLTEKFTEHEIAHIHECLTALIRDAICNHGKLLHQLNLLPGEEKHRLLVDFNDTNVNFPSDICIHTLFEEKATQNPDRIAVIGCDRSLTYRELDDQANRIANALIARGVQPGDIAAFSLPRRSYLISTMLGILKAGAAYMPIDLANPQERVQMILQQSGASCFITEEAVTQLLAWQNAQRPEVENDDHRLCYCISTSGSTGVPKIVQIRHENIRNTLFWKRCFTADHHIRTISVSGNTTDTFTEDVLFSLLSGRTIHLCDREEIIEVAKLIGKYPDCAIMTTPTLFNSIWSLLHREDHLKEVTLVGESLSSRFVQQIKAQVDTIYNEYGPSECAVCATRSLVDTNSKEITIGKPISNIQIYIVDKHMQPVPIGVTGELCIAGSGVGSGYLNRQDLTDAAFIDNPFGHGKLYRTGDLAYWREDGNIIYIGRNDFQVKIRGLRIELEEIENAICSAPGVSEAVVTVRKDETGRQLICAFYTGHAQVDVSNIKRIIHMRLPKYMMPHIFTRLEKMPTTASGKINRKALPEVDLHGVSREAIYARPSGAMEQRLASLLEQVLNHAPIGRNDNFFDMGGDSLKAIEFVSKAHTDGIYINLQAVFDHPTVKELCWFIQEGDRQQHPYTAESFVHLNKLLERNTFSSLSEPKAKDPGNILLAGSTGFLGMHILADFLDKNTGDAYCLVRAQNYTEAQKRFAELLQFYFGYRYNFLIGRRIHVVCGDLQQDRFGLGDRAYLELMKRVQTVINTAATVKHYGSYQYFYEVNVQTVKRLVAFCLAGGARFIHTSTLSVSGSGFHGAANPEHPGGAKHFSEQDLYIGQSLENVYVRSKFEAEKVVLEARAKGLESSIMRMGNLTNRRKDGLFQKNYETNAFLKRLKAISELGCVPRYMAEFSMEFTPVDRAAEAVMTIARHEPCDCSVFHIANPHKLKLGILRKYLIECGISLDVMDAASFKEVLQKTASNPKTAHILETFISDINKNGELDFGSDIEVHTEFTMEYLRRLGFTWADIDYTYIRDYVNYFRSIGYLEEV